MAVARRAGQGYRTTMQRVLGIDPGLRVTGYGVVDLADGALEPTLVEGGVFRFAGGQSIEDRLLALYRDLTSLTDESPPTHFAVKKLYAHYKPPRTAILMAHARGVILLCARQHKIPVEHL